MPVPDRLCRALLPRMSVLTAARRRSAARRCHRRCLTRMERPQNMGAISLALSSTDTAPEIGEAMLGIALAIGLAGRMRRATRAGSRFPRLVRDRTALH